MGRKREFAVPIKMHKQKSLIFERIKNGLKAKKCPFLLNLKMPTMMAALLPDRLRRKPVQGYLTCPERNLL